MKYIFLFYYFFIFAIILSNKQKQKLIEKETDITDTDYTILISTIREDYELNFTLPYEDYLDDAPESAILLAENTPININKTVCLTTKVVDKKNARI